jgi:molecular chaperone DnaK (HSP70)
VQAMLQSHLGRAPCTGVNPDEAVAYGAAVQAGILGGATLGNELLLLDVTPLSLGTEVEGGKFEVLIPRHSVVPTKKTDEFTTVEDNQDAIDFGVYQGERKIAKKNHLLGKFSMAVPPAPKGVPNIQLTYEIDANGILHVLAEDVTAGTKQSARPARY